MVAYPQAKAELRDKKALDVWARALADLEYTDVSHAITAWILTERWLPTIADIREKCHNLTAPPDALASAAWDQLIRALRRSYAPDSEDVWNQLPPITREIVGGYATFRAWGNTDTGQLESVQRPMFIKRFEQMQARDRKEAAVPQFFREPRPSLPDSCPSSAVPQIEDHKGRGVPAPQDRMEALRKRLGGGV